MNELGNGKIVRIIVDGETVSRLLVSAIVTALVQIRFVVMET